jgi:predicted DNA-binding transcriptional regulator AlpA
VTTNESAAPAIIEGERLLKWAQVRPRIGDVSRSTVWRWIRAGEFIKPVQLGKRRIAFRESELNLWLASRPAAQAYRIKA